MAIVSGLISIVQQVFPKLVRYGIKYLRAEDKFFNRLSKGLSPEVSRALRHGRYASTGYGLISGNLGDETLNGISVSESPITQTSQKRKTRGYMVKPRTKRKYETDCEPYQSRFRRTFRRR